MTKTKHKSRRESKNIINYDDDTPSVEDIDAIKFMFFQMLETKEIEKEIMELYHKEFGIDALDKSDKYYTENEQIERHAQNVVFWRKLIKEYDNVDKFEQIQSPKKVIFCDTNFWVYSNLINIEII